MEREKNLLSVALLTLNPPQINSTKSCPKKGTADNKLVITVALINSFDHKVIHTNLLNMQITQ